MGAALSSSFSGVTVATAARHGGFDEVTVMGAAMSSSFSGVTVATAARHGGFDEVM
jgi:hypothetical protein